MAHALSQVYRERITSASAESARALVRLVDQAHGPRAVVDADRWRRALAPVVERITHCGKSGRGDVGALEGFIPLGGGKLHDSVLHCENRVAAANVKQSDWWAAGTVPLLDLQAGNDPFMPETSRNALKNEFPERVTLAVIPNSSHALLPEQPKAVVEAIAGWVRKLP